MVGGIEIWSFLDLNFLFVYIGTTFVGMVVFVFKGLGYINF